MIMFADTKTVTGGMWAILLGPWYLLSGANVYVSQEMKKRMEEAVAAKWASHNGERNSREGLLLDIAWRMREPYKAKNFTFTEGSSCERKKKKILHHSRQYYPVFKSKMSI